MEFTIFFIVDIFTNCANDATTAIQEQYLYLNNIFV